MKLSEFIKQAQSLAGDTDPDVVLFNRATEETLVSIPDLDAWDYEVLRGENTIVIEFNDA